MFGKYAIFDNAKYYLKEEPEVYVEFRAPNAKDEVDIQVFLQSGPVTASAAGVTRTNLKVNSEIAIEELAMLIDMISVTNDAGEHIIRKGMDVKAKREIIAGFPAPLMWELWRALGERVPGWGSKVTKAPAAEDEDPKVEA